MRRMTITVTTATFERRWGCNDMTIHFLDLRAAYLELKAEIDQIRADIISGAIVVESPATP